MVAGHTGDPCNGRGDIATLSATQPPPPVPIPAVVNGYPVVSAIREREIDHSWIVLCRRTEQRPEFGTRPLYVVWHVWYAGGGYHAENGDYGPDHGLSWHQAQHSLRRRAGLDTNPDPSTEPAAGRHILVGGERVDVVTERRGDVLAIDVCDSRGFGCGDAQLANGTLSIEVPDAWTLADKTAVAQLIVHAAFTMEQHR